ncbi:penicillin-binding protein activator [Desulfuromonas acetoxidans]|uniref:Extracellular ligand-binding receptor n=1 Tax=Desulfuromonas acetoxidans (strain DSM 684 / 11070) TaxID=281689 RepID=Q1JW12_DESA6|nr:penicillin-binding protein activator [Desulfuromonas acetoxidans]EAT14434.1 Extracellular ligand-binding receptor [Desulfuromonas acetoxidans DSM 684]MBF0647065.1 penicillin-binding protein activator [Desulfuromonas acetoxidans]NVD24925.1 penicillin-binding protein activator [Desulfuromonas acetoxidans]NVE15226.1 penicillin-binding protein activator [Desulfuromonas acetoxidans]
MIKRFSRSLLMLMVAVCCVATAAQAVQLAAGDNASLSIDPAFRMYQRGENNQALSFLRSYLLDHADSPHLDSAYLLMARILLDEQKAADALFYLQRIELQKQTSEVTLLRVAALQQLGQLNDAEPLFGELSEENFFGDDLALYYRCRADYLQNRGQALQSLMVLSLAFQYTDNRFHQGFYDQVQQVLSGLDRDLVTEAAFMFADTPLKDVVILYQARQALDAGDVEHARHLVQPLVRQADIIDVQIAAANMLDQIDGSPWYQRAIGVVLPLSGRYAPFGELVKQGIELAVKSSAAPIQVFYQDSGADPQSAADAVRRLVRAQRVMAVIGPLTGDAAMLAVQEAEKAQVPIITLSYRDGLPQMGRYVFRNSLTPQQQVEALAEYAIEELGLNTYAILSPSNKMGQQYAQLFRQAIEMRGGDIEHQRSYGESATDFRRQLLLLKGEDPDAPQDAEPKVVDEEGDELVVEEEEEIAGLPNVDFEGLFIPDYADSVALIAPQIAYYGIENVQLLGINGWNSPQLIDQAGRYVRGSIICDGFFAQSPDAPVKQFVERYERMYGETPSILEAQGYDSVRLLLGILTDPAITTPQQLQQYLYQMEAFNGVTGLQGFDRQGEAQRALFMLKFGRKQLWQLRGLPEPMPSVEMIPIFE